MKAKEYKEIRYMTEQDIENIKWPENIDEQHKSLILFLIRFHNLLVEKVEIKNEKYYLCSKNINEPIDWGIEKVIYVVDKTNILKHFRRHNEPK